MYKGFQLIELMIVVAIVGILSTIAYPSLGQHFEAAHRLAAQKALLELASRLEQFQLLHHSYSEATLATLGTNEFTEGKFYRLMLEVGENNYLLSAVPQNKENCGVLTLNSLGQKTAKMRECWL